MTGVGIRDEHKTRFFVLPCSVLLPTFVLAGGRTGQKPKTRPVLQDTTRPDMRTPEPPILCSALIGTGCPVVSCPASYLRPGGRQDRTKIKNASCPTGQDKNKKRVLSYRTGQDTRTACPVISSGRHPLDAVFFKLRKWSQ